MSSGGAATLRRSEVLKSSILLPLITALVYRMNILFCVSALWFTRERSKRNLMIEGKPSSAFCDSGVNVRFADVAPVAISLEDSLIIYGVALCFSLTCFATAALLSILQSGLWLLAILAIVGVIAFSLFIRNRLPLHPKFGQYMFSCVAPLCLTHMFTATRAISVISRTCTVHLVKLGKRLFILTNPASHMPRCHRQAMHTTPLAKVLCTLISVIFTLLTRCSIARLRDRISVKVIDRFKSVTSRADLRCQCRAFRWILNEGLSLQTTLLISAGFTPRLRFSTSPWSPGLECIKRLVDMADRTHLGRKQRGLFNMIRFSHSYGPPDQVCSLEVGSADNASYFEHLFLIIAQNPFRSQLNVLSAGDWRAACH